MTCKGHVPGVICMHGVWIARALSWRMAQRMGAWVGTEVVIPWKLHSGQGVLRTRWPSERLTVTLRHTYNNSTYSQRKGAETLEYIKGNNQHNMVHNSNAKKHTEGVWLEHRSANGREWALCLLFFRWSNWKEAHGSGGVLGREGCCECTKTFRSTSGNTKLKRKVGIHQHSPKLPKFAKIQDATSGSRSSE